MAKQKILICPYCGETQPEAASCCACGEGFDGTTRRSRQAMMGPWLVREETHPHHHGIDYAHLARLVAESKITKYTIVRGPTTRQFWTVAKHVPGIAHLLGYCHECDAKFAPPVDECPGCGHEFHAFPERNWLGLTEADPETGEMLETPTTRLDVSQVSAFVPDDEIMERDTPGNPEEDPGDVAVEEEQPPGVPPEKFAEIESMLRTERNLVRKLQGRVALFIAALIIVSLLSIILNGTLKWKLGQAELAAGPTPSATE